MANITKFLKKNSFAIFLIILGGLIFFWTRNYKQVPSGIGPAFFPRVVATMLILFSAISIFLERNRELEGEVTPDRKAYMNIGITTVSLIIMVLLMQHVHALVGIFVFFVLYLTLISKENMKKTLMISAVGTAILYVTILVLRIPM